MTVSDEDTAAVSATNTPAKDAEAEPEVATEPRITRAQENAARSAEDYLEFSARGTASGHHGGAA